MYLCCGNSGATIVQPPKGNIITKKNNEEKKSVPFCGFDRFCLTMKKTGYYVLFKLNKDKTSQYNAYDAM